ncbi:MAG: hypothetical protein ABIR79_05950, partial [Candidatus Binatia bacterium]
MSVAILAVAACLSLVCAPIVAFAADGDPDSSFGTAGVAQDPTNGGGRLAVQSDGKILVAEFDTGGLRLLRFDTTGILHPTFGVGGIVTQPAPGEYMGEFVVLSNGDLLVLAVDGTSSVLARYDATGVPAASFGAAGVATLPDCAIGYDTDYDLAVQPDGKIVVGITSYTGDPSYEACLVRVDAGGIVDPGFGAGGVVVLPGWFVAAVALQGDRVLVGGAVTDGDTFPAAIMRLGSDGGSLGGFGNSGVFTHPGGRVVDLAVQENGDIYAFIPRGSDHADVLRVSASGALDASFGTGGVAVIEGPPDSFNGSGKIALQADGKIVVAATFGESHAPIGFQGGVQLTRLDADGTADASFGSGGSQTSVWGSLRGFALQSDGKILVLGV